ncbi:hypothetical protein HBB16_21335 [Pseudonocardia sp. MCCB 268]|nr:hypothetical protein [Pseudonocardia cytotoxica]
MVGWLPAGCGVEVVWRRRRPGRGAPPRWDRSQRVMPNIRSRGSAGPGRPVLIGWRPPGPKRRARVRWRRSPSRRPEPATRPRCRHAGCRGSLERRARPWLRRHGWARGIDVSRRSRAGTCGAADPRYRRGLRRTRDRRCLAAADCRSLRGC